MPQQRRGTHVPAVAAPRTSIDLTSLGAVLSVRLLYFPVPTTAAAAAASSHFLPSLFDAPSVAHAFVWYREDIC